VTTSPHLAVNPAALAPPVGFSHAMVAGPGRSVHLGGQIAAGTDGAVVGSGFREQFGVALDNVVTTLAACGARPDDVVSLMIFTTDMAGYRAGRKALGEAYRSRFGRHYPAVALVAVGELYEPEAVVEIVATAVIPDSAGAAT